MGATRAVVVYESLFGNTAAIARAIAEGIGPGARALSTAEATALEVAEAALMVAGAPVHAMGLPSDKTREQARTGQLGPGGAAPDLSHPPMRAWLDALPQGHGRYAAFETRVGAWYGRGAAPKIAGALAHAGYQPLAEARGFGVGGHRLWPSTDGTLLDGEVDRAREWGAELARAMG
jgi:hypothetical protein